MELKDLRQVITESGFNRRQLRWFIDQGVLKTFQPTGPRGKHYVTDEELRRFMQPVQRGAK